jgi:AcrR family transcriptional regulator
MVQPKTRNRIVDALLALAAERRFEDVTLEAVAERAGISLAALRAAYDGRLAILADFVRRTDERVLAGLDPDLASEAPRERLFDVLFARFGAVAPHKPAIRSLAAAARRDPALALALNGIVVPSMGWMLSAAGISAAGGRGLCRAQGLALVWARVMRVFLDDDDPGLARTMAALDRQLRRAERTVIRLDRLARIVCRPRRRPSRRGSAADGADLAEGHPS